MAAPPGDRKRGRAAWAEEQYKLNEAYRLQHALDDSDAEGSVMITVKDGALGFVLFGKRVLC